jgi:hypothetical protein
VKSESTNFLFHNPYTHPFLRPTEYIRTANNCFVRTMLLPSPLSSVLLLCWAAAVAADETTVPGKRPLLRAGAAASRELQTTAGCVSTIPETVPYHIIAKHSNLVLRTMEDDNSIVQAYSSTGQADNWVLLPGPTPTAYIIQAQGTTNKLIGTCAHVDCVVWGDPSRRIAGSCLAVLAHNQLSLNLHARSLAAIFFPTTTTTITTNQSPGVRATLAPPCKYRLTLSPMVATSGASSS